jgi:anaerobic selenocysteine-containing dehydrogenase
MDLFMTPTSEKADLFLPAATFLERVELCDYYGTLQAVPYIAMRRKLFQVGEAVSDLDFWIELGKRMGYGEHFPWADATEALDYALEPSGITVHDVESRPEGGMPFGKVRLDNYRVKNGFFTPSRKVELFSSTLHDLGHDGIPQHRPGPNGLGTASPGNAAVGDAAAVGGDTAAGDHEFPLLLTTGARTLQYLHSEHRDIERLAKRRRYAEAELHPDTAEEYGIEPGEAIVIESPYGSVTMSVRITDGILPGVVAVPHGWRDASVNDITDETPGDPITGYPILKSAVCRVRPVSPR